MIDFTFVCFCFWGKRGEMKLLELLEKEWRRNEKWNGIIEVIWIRMMMMMMVLVVLTCIDDAIGCCECECAVCFYSSANA